MKKIILFLLLTLSINTYTQSYLQLGIQNGYVIDFQEPKVPVRMGLGFNVNYAIPSYLKIASGFNYTTFEIQCINYPHKGIDYGLSHFNNGINDAFHYAKLALGYRMSLRIPEQSGSFHSYRGWDRIEGLSFEPQVGTLIYNQKVFENPTWLLAYKLNYIRKNVQLSFYHNYALAKYHTSIGYFTTFDCGIGIGCVF